MKRILVAAAAGAAFTLGACSNDTAPTRGTLSVQLTDAPFPFDSVASVDMFVVRIDGKLADVDSAAAEQGKNDDVQSNNPRNGWVTIATPNASFNLLTLQGGKTANLGQTSIPTGTYRGFRLVLDTDKSSITLKNGTVLKGNTTPGIKWPSAGRSGVKIVLDEPIAVTSGQTVMTVDFDLGRSFVLRGTSISTLGVLFKPVIRATAVDITGSIAGEVRAGTAAGAVVGDASVELLKAGTPVGDTVSANVVATTKSDASGVYKFGFVLPATYAIRATPPATSTNGKGYVASVTVANSQAVTGQMIVLP
jgi:hypothetical protein